MVFKFNSVVLEIQHKTLAERVDWGVGFVQAPQVWTQTRGEGIKVLVLDTGIDYRHPDLATNFKGGANFTSGDRGDVMDRQGHGTHCAGIISASQNGFGVIGVAPEAHLYAGKVLGDDGTGGTRALVRGIEYGIQQGVDIISMSLGSSVDPGEELHDAVKRAKEKGIVLVAASGNEAGNIGWPAVYEEVIAVGAIDQALESAAFSNFGPELNVSAPGVDILSTYLNNTYARLSGTSMATPIVTGVVALLLSYGRRYDYDTSPEAIIRIIAERSVDVGELGKDDRFGNGFINVYKLIKHRGNNRSVRRAEMKIEQIKGGKAEVYLPEKEERIEAKKIEDKKTKEIEKDKVGDKANDKSNIFKARSDDKKNKKNK